MLSAIFHFLRFFLHAAMLIIIIFCRHFIIIFAFILIFIITLYAISPLFMLLIRLRAFMPLLSRHAITLIDYLLIHKITDAASRPPCHYALLLFCFSPAELFSLIA